ncbi:hypothetical protein [uncultured Gimesia sp.]|uniref:hypothetical protein n=1 Tax=uncultured Gimesia sp. TaxID=1678688 RepID=UPI0026064AB7|nr:hypothetical protein [uncultured Gimesia sp.]
MRDFHSFSWMLLTVFLGCFCSLTTMNNAEAVEPQKNGGKVSGTFTRGKRLSSPTVRTSSPLQTLSSKKSVKVPAGTHEQIAIIEVGSKSDSTMRINTFCMNKAGNLIAACGNGPGEIRVFNRDGKLLETWKVPIAPDAINVDEDDMVYIAGSGKLIKLDSHGKLLMTKDAPHAKAVKENSGKLREQVVQQMKARSNVTVTMVPRLQKMIDDIKSKSKTLSEQEKKRIVGYESIMAHYKKMEKETKQKQLTEKEIDAQVEALSKRKLRVSSLSTNDKEIFIACSAATGYGYEVWRTDKNYENGKIIVKGLRGCCGQMDVQCNQQGIFVAENSRHRVNHYDSEGKLIKYWGKRDRNGVEGFGSCCNPMNVAVGRNGEVYTAESNLGYIKRYSTEGKYLDFIGKVKLVPGCKNVSIMVSPDGSRVYMMDLTRNHIIVMAQKPTATASTSKKKG